MQDVPLNRSFMHLHLGFDGEGLENPGLHHIHVRDWRRGVDAEQVFLDTFAASQPLFGLSGRLPLPCTLCRKPPCFLTILVRQKMEAQNVYTLPEIGACVVAAVPFIRGLMCQPINSTSSPMLIPHVAHYLWHFIPKAPTWW